MKIFTGKHTIETTVKSELLCAECIMAWGQNTEIKFVTREWGFQVFASRKHSFIIAQVVIERDGPNCLEELWSEAIEWLKNVSSRLDNGP